MKLGIISALDLEIELLIEKLIIKKKSIIAGFHFYESNYNGIDIILAICDVGKTNSASCTQILINNFKITHIINLGVGGSLRKNISKHDLVISDGLSHHDVRKTQMINRFPFQLIFKPSEYLKNLAIESAKNINKNYHVGKIVSGEAFVTDIELREKIIAEHDPACVEMEGSSVAHVAYINNVEFLVIRSISDYACEGTKLNSDIIRKASENGVELLWEMINNLNNFY